MGLAEGSGCCCCCCCGRRGAVCKYLGRRTEQRRASSARGRSVGSAGRDVVWRGPVHPSRFDSSQTLAAPSQFPPPPTSIAPLVNHCPLLFSLSLLGHLPSPVRSFFLLPPRGPCRASSAAQLLRFQLRISILSTPQTKRQTPAQPPRPLARGPRPNERLLPSGPSSSPQPESLHRRAARTSSLHRSAAIAIHPTPACTLPLRVGQRSRSDLGGSVSSQEERRACHPCPRARAG